MKFYAIVHPGMEELAQQEIKEIIGADSILGNCVIEFESTKEEMIVILQRNQTFRRLLFSLDRNKVVDKLSFNFSVPDFFIDGGSHAIDLEHIKGEEKRQEITKSLGKSLHVLLDKAKIKSEVNFKEHDVPIVCHYTGEEYILGIDLAGFELHKRPFRVFAHSASFTGDIAYFLIRKTGFKAGEKFLAGFCKDGGLAIEAALYVNGKIVNKGRLALLKFPLFRDLEIPISNQDKTVVFAFDDSMPNVTAAKKNVSIAGVKDLVEVSKYALDDLDVKYSQNFFDRVVFQLTTKDENNINEVYYQVKYILKSGGRLMLVTRKNFDLSISENFKLLEQEELQRGESSHVVWLLQKK
jgi:23S rRNA G2445 N2-methylase RlmL